MAARAASSAARSSSVARAAARLDDAAQLVQVFEQARARLASELPPQDVAVEQAPVGPGPDERAAFGPGVDHALGREHLQRLAQHGQADVELLLQRRDVERGALRELPGHDPLCEDLDRLTMHTARRILLHPRLSPHRVLWSAGWSWNGRGRGHAEDFIALHPPSTTRLVPVM
jgi:hypothetical protein